MRPMRHVQALGLIVEAIDLRRKSTASYAADDDGNANVNVLGPCCIWVANGHSDVMIPDNVST
eukprot:CAMPEP_0171919588 /NCGR_PEP_ID=MMETSP0993-20121228/18293_1 /TAXON_ID=483369 /ORGANISM="non described non described, Strain CCMP2098" /LENGTH=62 /DNA_ID=CAMNT_0012556295 /DNA_START=139 /DNA_END=323 /DNA_ORIENTATION=+